MPRCRMKITRTQFVWSARLQQALRALTASSGVAMLWTVMQYACELGCVLVAVLWTVMLQATTVRGHTQAPCGGAV